MSAKGNVFRFLFVMSSVFALVIVGLFFTLAEQRKTSLAGVYDLQPGTVVAVSIDCERQFYVNKDGDFNDGISDFPGYFVSAQVNEDGIMVYLFLYADSRRLVVLGDTPNQVWNFSENRYDFFNWFTAMPDGYWVDPSTHCGVG